MPSGNDESAEFTYGQSAAMLLGAHIRNEMERLHDRIDDELMAEINVTVRYAIQEFFDVLRKDDRSLRWLASTVPLYWELPGRDPKPVFTGAPLLHGKPYPPRESVDK